MDTTILNELPESLRDRIALSGGVLHISEELQGNAQLESYLSLAKRHGISKYEWHKSSSFDSFRRQNAQPILRTDSDIQNYAVTLLKDAFDLGASDIHINNFGSYGTIRFRRMGMLQDYSQLTADTAEKLIRAIYSTMSTSTSSADFSPTDRQDGRISSRDYLPPTVHSVRVHTEPLECGYTSGTKMALRLLYDRTSATGDLEHRLGVLGYAGQDVKRFKFLTGRTGATIIAGPTGHGKSTLLKHLMEAMAGQNPEKSYMSIEDPPEYPLVGVSQVMVSTKVTNDPDSRGRSYTNAIAGAMRSDPDTLMIGEMRYPEAAAAVIDAALTGHGVMSTLHANNALGIIRRMLSLLNAANYVDPLEFLTDHNVLAGLVYQRLIPLLCPKCKIKLVDMMKDKQAVEKCLPNQLLDRLMPVLKDLENVYVRGEGCSECQSLGIVGQTVAAEVIVTDHTLLRYIRNNQLPKANDYWLHDLKGRTYIDHAIELIGQGVVDPYLTELRLGVPLNFAKVFEDFAQDSGGSPLLMSGNVVSSSSTDSFPHVMA